MNTRLNSFFCVSVSFTSVGESFRNNAICAKRMDNSLKRSSARTFSSANTSCHAAGSLKVLIRKRLYSPVSMVGMNKMRLDGVPVRKADREGYSTFSGCRPLIL